MKSKRFVTIFILAAMLLSLTGVCQASYKFSDVPKSHWAYQDINTMAEGGLVEGYGNGKFGPNDPFAISHMATIICNALGKAPESKNGYWAYGAIDYCIHELKCLPDFGAITAGGAYEKVCTRELATYMLINGLGASNNDQYLKKVSLGDIPDWYDISDEYRDAVLESYQHGMTVGVDSKGTFLPKSTLTRAQGVTMLVRAGYTKKADTAVITDGGIENSVAWEKIKGLTEMNCYEHNGVPTMVPTDPKYGGIQIRYLQRGQISILINEWNRNAWFSGNNLIDVNGNIVPDKVNSNNIFVMSTGYSYSARRLVHDILKIAYPTQYEEAYAAYRDVLSGKVNDFGGGYPNATRWLDSKELGVSCSKNCVSIWMGVLNDVDGYNRSMAYRSDVPKEDCFFYTSREEANQWYELNKW